MGLGLQRNRLGGKDIYSGSKGAAELIIKSYYHSFFKNMNHFVKLAVGRAGNVIGGGDWALDRVVVDAVKAWSQEMAVEIRCPDATRPWQHVLEPLSGYLSLGQNLVLTGNVDGEAFNFGPRGEQNRTVLDLLTSMSEIWHAKIGREPFKITATIPFKAGLLKLNCDKALSCLNWDATLSYNETVKMTSNWYSEFFTSPSGMLATTNQQIDEYGSLPKKRISLDKIDTSRPFVTKLLK